ncbi:unnamed protein product [Ilex paraguariensis]|uniref:Uncharacterized protein n=2 Tax=Ilex paraguariensis TaxID=185542 RepID=A0ABC8UC97_9AQUA
MEQQEEAPPPPLPPPPTTTSYLLAPSLDPPRQPDQVLSYIDWVNLLSSPSGLHNPLLSEGISMATENLMAEDDMNNNKVKRRAGGRNGKSTRPRFAFQTRSADDILDDGFRWRKYGQKAVKNSIYPRSYYRCTHHTCNVKKQAQEEVYTTGTGKNGTNPIIQDYEFYSATQEQELGPKLKWAAAKATRQPFSLPQSNGAPHYSTQFPMSTTTPSSATFSFAYGGAPPPPNTSSISLNLTKLGIGYAIAITLGFLVLFSTILLTSYICCRYRRSQNPNPNNSSDDNGIYLPRIIFVAEDDDEEDNEIVAVGLDQAVINSYPRFAFSKDRGISGGNSDSMCSICLCEYKNSEMLRILPDCKHYFHLTCIDAWLKLNASCPVCRSSPLPTPLSTPLQEVVPLSQYSDGRRR